MYHLSHRYRLLESMIVTWTKIGAAKARGGEGAAQLVKEPEKTGARSASARSEAKIHN